MELLTEKGPAKSNFPVTKRRMSSESSVRNTFNCKGTTIQIVKNGLSSKRVLKQQYDLRNYVPDPTNSAMDMNRHSM
jgi:hypothetical protein